jgi:endonuclease YncB( thermonuclease family)
MESKQIFNKTLLCATSENTPLLTLDNCKHYCKCIEVYDGDTVTLAVPFGTNSEYYKVKCRLLSIDTAEIRTRNVDEKKYGYETRDYLKKKILGQIVWVDFKGWGKFGGRLLGTIYMHETDEKNNGFDGSVNALLLNEGKAYLYDGKHKKKDFEEWHTPKHDIAI